MFVARAVIGGVGVVVVTSSVYAFDVAATVAAVYMLLPLLLRCCYCCCSDRC